MNPDPESTCRACLKKKKKLYGIFNEIYMGLSIADIFGKIINPKELEIKKEDGISSYFCSPCKTMLFNFYEWECQVKKNQDLLMKMKKGVVVREENLVSSVNKENASSYDTIGQSNDVTIIKNEPIEDNDVTIIKNEPIEDKPVIPDETILVIITNDESDCKSEYAEEDEEVVFDEPSPLSEDDDNKETDYLIIPERDVKNHPAKNYYCKFCHQCFLQDRLLTVHMKEKHGSTSKDSSPESRLGTVINHCNICDLNFDDWPSYQEHMRNHRNYSCDQCGKSYSKKTHLNDHKESHLPFNLYVCNYCGKSFRLRSSFHSHQRIHTKPRSYICETCGQAFNAKATMKTHMRLIHLKDRSYVCHLCNQAFPLQGTLSKHIRRRHNEREKIYECTECPMAYWENATLKRHMSMKHSQERQKFPCDYCGKEYSTKSILKRHVCKVIKSE